MGCSAKLAEELPDFAPREYCRAMRAHLASVYAAVLAADFDAADLPKQMCDGRCGLVPRLGCKPALVGKVAQVLIQVRRS